MELKKVIESRVSIREYGSEEVSLDDVKEMIRLAGLAPSINNYQPWKFIAITNRAVLNSMVDKIMEEIARLPENSSRMAKIIKKQAAWYSTFFHNAPLLLALAGRAYETEMEKGVVLSHEELDRIKNYPDFQSAGACIQNLLLAATDLGYGTCWMTGPLYAREAIQQILNIRDPWRLISFVTVGKHGQKEARQREKRNIADEMEIID